MTQEKLRKIITASVAAATLLLVFLLTFLIYQGITIAVLNKRIKTKEAEIARLEQVNETASNDLEKYKADIYKEFEALKLGWIHSRSEDK